jgi:hypothetical protein
MDAIIPIGAISIDHYRVMSTDYSWQTRSRELPLGGMLLDFGEPSPFVPNRKE